MGIDQDSIERSDDENQQQEQRESYEFSDIADADMQTNDQVVLALEKNVIPSVTVTILANTPAPIRSRFSHTF